jgi:hypothetical protein
MYIGKPKRPLSGLDDLEVHRERLLELIDAGLVTMGERHRFTMALAEIERQIDAIRNQFQRRAAA